MRYFYWLHYGPNQTIKNSTFLNECLLNNNNNNINNDNNNNNNV